jgi:acetyltransferase-like isoleucine patch superfamily enzyme
MKKFLTFIAQTGLTQVILTLIVYSLYAAVLGVCFFAPVLIVFYTFSWWILPFLVLNTVPGLLEVLFFSLSLGVAFYVYLILGSIIMAILVRFFSLGIKPGRYLAISLTTLRWLIYSGIYSLARITILPLIPVTPFMNLYLRICGCKMGKNVRVNNRTLNDAYLITIGDNVVIGSDTDISCHLFEANHLILDPIVIEANCLIGTHCYISPGVHIGRNSVIGLYSFIRRGKKIPEKSRITSLSGLPMKRMYELEKGIKK